MAGGAREMGGENHAGMTRVSLDRRRLVMVVRLLDSPHDGEKLAAIAAAKRLLDAAGMSWAELVEREPEPPIRQSANPSDHGTRDDCAWRNLLDEISGRNHALLDRGIGCMTPWEIDFVESLYERWSPPTPKQSAILDRIKAKIIAMGG